jgi:hypothetical protein
MHAERRRRGKFAFRACGGRSSAPQLRHVNKDQLTLARERLLLALVLAGLTGDETFGDLLDAIDEYAGLSVQAALDEVSSGACSRRASPRDPTTPRSGGSSA